jgi:proteasome accessory factor B
MPIQRLHHIHERLLAGGYPNCSEIARELEVTRKTVQRDITFMRDALSLPLSYDERQHGYYYTDRVTSFPAFKVTLEDLASLFVLRVALRSIRGTAMADKLRPVFAGMTQMLDGEVSFSWSDLDDAFSRKAFEVTGADLKRFGKLADAVLKRRVVSFCYRKLGATTGEVRRVEPYHLGEVDGCHYLIGRDLDRGALRTFALPRMSSLALTGGGFLRPADFSGPEHLRGSFGIWTREGDATRHLVRVELSDYAARLVQERRWHPTQEVSALNAKATRVEVRFEVGALEEVVRWVLSWGGKAKVLAPPELKSRVKAEVRAMAGQ